MTLYRASDDSRSGTDLKSPAWDILFDFNQRRNILEYKPSAGGFDTDRTAREIDRAVGFFI
jgi:hypothetical protein